MLSVLKERFATKIRRCFTETLFGPLWIANGTVTIYDIGQYKRLRQLLDQVTDTIGAVLLGRMPCEPVIAKWTKLLPSATFFLMSNVYGLLHGLLSSASTGFVYPQRADDAAGGDQSPQTFHR
jgi:hypothetical protein